MFIYPELAEVNRINLTEAQHRALRGIHCVTVLHPEWSMDDALWNNHESFGPRCIGLPTLRVLERHGLIALTFEGDPQSRKWKARLTDGGLIAFNYSEARKAAFFVNPDGGSDDNDGESPQSAKATLASAYALAEEYDMIYLLAGQDVEAGE